MLVLLLFAVLSLGTSTDFQSHCQSELASGRTVLRRFANEIARDERSRLRSAYESTLTRLLHDMEVVELDASAPTPPVCPAPNNTMFTTPAPSTTTPKPSTPSTTTISTTAGGMSTTAAGGITSPSSGTTSSGSGTTSSKSGTTPAGAASTAAGGQSTTGAAPLEEHEDVVPFRPLPLLTPVHEKDPFATYIQTLFDVVSSPNKVCDGPTFTDFNSVSEHQLYGFLATLAASQPGPFCSVCHRLVDHVRERLFTPNKLLLTEEELVLTRLLYSQVPSTKSICSSIAPGCYDGYEQKVKNITEAVVCIECSACMTVTNLLQHRVLLQSLDKLLHFLQSSLFHNICAELCPVFGYGNYTIFPHFTYQGCQDWFTSRFAGFMRFVTVLTRPERLCSLELGWCELNETPNMLHCLKDLCDEMLTNTPQTRWLCSQIPDSPEQADQFLNIQDTKIYKKKKTYHEEVQRRNHDEL